MTVAAPSQVADLVVSSRPARRGERRNRLDLGAEVRLQPVSSNGAQRGYRAYARSDAARFASIGLDPGDLLLSINGLPLSDPSRSEQVFQQAARAERVTVQIERAGRRAYLQLVNGLHDRYVMQGPFYCSTGDRERIYVQQPPVVAISPDDKSSLDKREPAR